MTSMTPLDGINLVLNLLMQAQKVSALIMAAQNSGRYTLDADEIKAIRADRDQAFDELEAAIENAKDENVEQPEQEKKE